MNAFRPSNLQSHFSKGAAVCPGTCGLSAHVAETKKVIRNGVPFDVVVRKVVPQSELLEKSSIPDPEDYDLGRMLRAGYKPEKVPVQGLLNSSDPLDTANLALVEDAAARTILDSEGSDVAADGVAPDPSETPNEK